MALKCSAKGLIEEIGLKGPPSVGGEWGSFQKGCTAHPETLMMELVKLWFACWKEQKSCCQLVHVCVPENTGITFPCRALEDNFWQSLVVCWRR